MWIFKWKHVRLGWVDDGPHTDEFKAETARLAKHAEGFETSGPEQKPDTYLLDYGYFLGEVINPFDD